METENNLNPCLKCGACCAFYRASFYWAECDDATPGGVPAILTSSFGPFRRIMNGTNGGSPRCVALLGTVSSEVRCTIYPNRASVCRDFNPSWLHDEPNPRCDKARIAWNLEPLRPGWSSRPGREPLAA